MSKEKLKEIEKIVIEARFHLDEVKNNGDYDYPKHDEIALSLFDNKHIDWLINFAKEQHYRNSFTKLRLGDIRELVYIAKEISSEKTVRAELDRATVVIDATLEMVEDEE